MSRCGGWSEGVTTVAHPSSDLFSFFNPRKAEIKVLLLLGAIESAGMRAVTRGLQ